MFLNSPKDTQEKCFDNYRAFESSGLVFSNEIDLKIYGFISSFASEYSEVPSYTSIVEHFNRQEEYPVVDRLSMFCHEPSIHKGDFILRLDQRIEDQKRNTVHQLLSEAAQILQTGLKEKDGREDVWLRGPVAAVQRIMDKGHDIITPPRSEKLAGNVTTDILAAKEEYLKRKNDPTIGYGALTGIKQIDTLGGSKRKELWTHAAFTGGLKSTFALNWLYNQSIHYGKNVMMTSLEMPYAQCRRILQCMHTIHPKFKEIRMELGIQRDPFGDVGLSYAKVRDGLLTSDEEKFFFDYVLEDYVYNKDEYGALEIFEADPNKSKFTTVDIRHRAETISAKHPLDMMIVDHGGLVHPSKNYHSTTESQNEVMRNLKKLAMGFNGGQGIGVVALFQINREGFKSAQKNGGKYNLTHLSYANECEKSSDIVTAGYIDDELRQKNKILFQCLKSRDNAPFEDFYLRVEWPCRKLFECDGAELTSEQAQDYGDQIDALSDEDFESLF
jgi:replicative DNA helicase